MDKRRSGAPRKPALLKKQRTCIALPRWLLEWMREQELSNPVLIERAMADFYGIKPPLKHDAD